MFLAAHFQKWIIQYSFHIYSVPSDMGEPKRRILLFLYNVKFMKSVPGPWKATDDAVLEFVSQYIKGRMSIDELRKCVVEMENDVKLDIVSSAIHIIIPKLTSQLT